MGEAAEELRTDELRRDIDERRASMSDTLEAIGDRVSPGRIVERRKNRVVAWSNDMRDRVMGTAHEVTDTMADKARSAGSAPSDAMETVRSNTAGAPLVAGGIAFGIGMLVGSLLPPSRTEKQLAGQAAQAVEPVKQELREAGRQMVDELKEPVSDAVQDVKDSTKERVQDVRQTAGDAAQDVKETAASRTQRTG
jgi:ElaB/YqjD/DUF883 family membrane-anchored ribosome-binding protein